MALNVMFVVDTLFSGQNGATLSASGWDSYVTFLVLSLPQRRFCCPDQPVVMSIEPSDLSGGQQMAGTSLVLWARLFPFCPQ